MGKKYNSYREKHHLEISQTRFIRSELYRVDVSRSSPIPGTRSFGFQSVSEEETVVNMT